MRDSPPPPISLTVATVDGWPHVRSSIASLEAAAAGAGGEVVVLDGSGRTSPGKGEIAATTRWILRPGLSVFQLRRIGFELARAPLIAITEDHCRVPDDWARRLIAAHASHPDAAAIGGSVENGATRSSIDWASFIAVQATQMAPIETGIADRVAGAVNVSYRGSALVGLDDFDGLGVLDTLHQRGLAKSGAVLINDDSIRVVHDQSLGWGGTIRIHYHAGRTFAAFIRRRPGRRGMVRMVGVLLIPYVRFARAVLLGRRKGYGAVIGRTWPLILGLYVVQGAGQIVGFLAGPGDSPRQVR